MAKPRQTKSGKFELCIKHALLPKRLYLTFDTEQAANEYRDEANKWLAAGIVPAALLPVQPDQPVGIKLTVLMQRWRNDGQLSKTDDAILAWLLSDTKIKDVPITALTYPWAEGWVNDMKMVRNLAPSTIRQRVQAVSRCIDWYLRSNPKANAINPLRLLPRGYSVYSDQQTRKLRAQGRDSRRDVVRDRRLLPGEQQRIEQAMMGVKREDRERPLAMPNGPAMVALFYTILLTGARLREAYTIRKENVNLADKVLRIQSTKQRNGNIVFRNIPMRPELHAVLRKFMTPGKGLLFPFWDGDSETLADVTNRLSHRFTSIFKYAECDGLTEHDLRHEATCQWYELRDAKGGWLYRDAEINKIMGWSATSVMAARYASFRAENLAVRLWAKEPAPDTPAAKPARSVRAKR